MINKVAHLADIHVRKSTARHEEYKKIFNTVYANLVKQKPDRIVITGDLYHDFLDLSGEAQLLMASFLNNLSRIALVIIQRGNHDIMKKNLNRVNVIESLTKLINNPNVVYYDQSGFYEDDNVMWVVWNHRDKLVKNPWLEIPHTKKKNFTYINLYHDPIDGSLDQAGKPMHGNYEPISSFKGDFTFAGDLHYYQVFGKDNTMGYPSSLIQQNFGETPYKHGYILWDLKNKSHEFVEVANDHVYINFDIQENTNYDKLKLESPYIKSEPEFKVRWTDLVSNINKVNETKIRQHIKDKYGIDKVRIEKKPIYTNITDIKFVNEGIDINSIDVQTELFKEYLLQNKYSDEFISSVLELDAIINAKLNDGWELSPSVDWRIPKFWFDNFKSYGDGNIIDWSSVNGLIQIHGKNQQGKTTILDAICYILYGKTLSTKRVVKGGDGRYINNKRSLDECSGGAQIYINDDPYIIARKSVRKWNAAKTEVTGVKTTLEYYKGTEMTEENKLTDETLKKTQPIIDSALGTFDDFVRIVLTNADNLNDLLSIDRSVFMDAIIRDAGYDIFEIKLKAYKEYIKELDETRLVVDLVEENEQIKRNEIALDELTNKLNDILYRISQNKEQEQIERSIKDEFLKKLHVVDESIVGLSVDDLEASIVVNEEKITINTRKIETLDRDNSLIPYVEAFDDADFKNKKVKFDNDSETVSRLREEVSDLKSDIKILEIEVAQTDEKIDVIIKNKISEIGNANVKLHNNSDNIKKDVIQLIKDHLNGLKEQIQVSKNEIEKIKTKQDSIVEKSQEYKTTISESEESPFCITCGARIESEHMEHIKVRIAELKNSISALKEEYTQLELDKKKHQSDIDSILARTAKIQNKNFEDEPELKAKYDNTLLSVREIQRQIDENDSNIQLLQEHKYEKFVDVMNSIHEIRLAKVSKESNLAEKKDILEVKIKNGSDILASLKEQKSVIDGLEERKTFFENRKNNNNQRGILVLENENLNLKIASDRGIVARINAQRSMVEENQKNQLSIDAVQQKIANIVASTDGMLDEKDRVCGNIKQVNDDIADIKARIDAYVKQMRVDEIRKVYMQTIHRDGLPTYLLKKSIHVINQELSNLLTNVDFTVFFDEELVLKLSSDSRLDVTQDAVESSGKERTFAALALKVALRKINKKSKPDFVMFDEVMGKLYAESVDEFMEFLNDISKELGKVIIIEHVHTINYEAIIEVSKDAEGISSLEFV